MEIVVVSIWPVQAQETIRLALATPLRHVPSVEARMDVGKARSCYQHRSRLGCEANIGLRIEKLSCRQDACARLTEKEYSIGGVVEIWDLPRRAADGRAIRRLQFSVILDVKADGEKLVRYTPALIAKTSSLPWPLTALARLEKGAKASRRHPSRKVAGPTPSDRLCRRCNRHPRSFPRRTAQPAPTARRVRRIELTRSPSECSRVGQVVAFFRLRFGGAAAGRAAIRRRSARPISACASC